MIHVVEAPLKARNVWSTDAHTFEEWSERVQTKKLTALHDNVIS